MTDVPQHHGLGREPDRHIRVVRRERGTDMRNILGAVTMLVLVCAIGAGCATGTSSAPAPAADVTGTWTGTYQLAGGIRGDVKMVLKQAGSQVTGDQTVGGYANLSGPISDGRVEGTALRYRAPAGGSNAMQVQGDDMTGMWPSGFDVKLKRQK
jgi:hypothetical protein